jgi:hypothetical protein
MDVGDRNKLKARLAREKDAAVATDNLRDAGSPQA